VFAASAAFLASVATHAPSGFDLTMPFQRAPLKTVVTT
jgi:hypothetical protein